MAVLATIGVMHERTSQHQGMVAVTGVVCHLVLRQLQKLQGDAAFADLLLHTMSPLLCVVGWLCFGPRGAVDRRAVVGALVFPIAWLAFTLLRGTAVGFWPYPFLNVRCPPLST